MSARELPPSSPPQRGCRPRGSRPGGTAFWLRILPTSACASRTGRRSSAFASLRHQFPRSLSTARATRWRAGRTTGSGRPSPTSSPWARDGRTRTSPTSSDASTCRARSAMTATVHPAGRRRRMSGSTATFAGTGATTCCRSAGSIRRSAPSRSAPERRTDSLARCEDGLRGFQNVRCRNGLRPQFRP